MVKPHINNTIREPSRKQIIISIDQSNMSVIINHANTFIRNINNYLCERNLNVVVDFIGLEDHRAIITTNQADSS